MLLTTGLQLWNSVSAFLQLSVHFSEHLMCHAAWPCISRLLSMTPAVLSWISSLCFAYARHNTPTGVW